MVAIGKLELHGSAVSSTNALMSWRLSDAPSTASEGMAHLESDIYYKIAKHHKRTQPF
jgi:hypothetical protein